MVQSSSSNPVTRRPAGDPREVAGRLKIILSEAGQPLPDTLVVLGSGFKGFEERLGNPLRLPLNSVAGMPVPTVEGHGADLVFGALGGRRVAVMTGRLHLYEGHDADAVTLPLRSLALLGLRRVLLSNAAGAVSTAWSPGDVVLVRDQINLTGTSSLLGAFGAAFGPRFLDMGMAFAPEWRERLVRRTGLREGVYAGVLGPAYETPAEALMLARLGADVVGMSTVLEVLAARQHGLAVACLSFVTNMAGGLGMPLSHGDVLELVVRHRTRLQDLLATALEEAP